MRDLLWRPIGRLVRFVWTVRRAVDHPVRGRLILISSDPTLDALAIIAAYGYRFKIELAGAAVRFKQAIHAVGSYGYHFWMMAMTPLKRRRGNRYLHRASDDYRRLVRRKLDRAADRLEQTDFERCPPLLEAA